MWLLRLEEFLVIEEPKLIFRPCKIFGLKVALKFQKRQLQGEGETLEIVFESLGYRLKPIFAGAGQK